MSLQEQLDSLTTEKLQTYDTAALQVLKLRIEAELMVRYQPR